MNVFAQSPGPAEVVQAQLDAYNAQDVFAFADLFAEDAVIYMNIGDQSPSLLGRDAIREFYGDMFSAFPNNRSAILSRSVQGNFVFDHESISGRDKPLKIMAIYEVVNGQIVRVWFAR
jgi:putative hydrolase of HD superfamily